MKQLIIIFFLLFDIQYNLAAQTSKINKIDVEGIYVPVLPDTSMEESIAMMLIYAGKLEAMIILQNGIVGSAEIDMQGKVISTIEVLAEYKLVMLDTFVSLTYSTSSLLGTSTVNLLFDPATSIFAIYDLDVGSNVFNIETILSTYASGVTYQRIGTSKGLQI